jgi:branched-chain amino acid transport system substrate-binding protein
MKRNLIILIIIVFLSVLFLGNRRKANKEIDIIKIGVSLPLTGNLAETGISSQKSLMIALDKINSQKNKYKYELIFEDDAYNAMKVTPAVTKLLNIDKVKAMITTGSIAGNVVSNYNNNIDNGFIHINGAAYDNNIAKGDNNFLIGGVTKALAKEFVKEIKRRNYKNIVVIAQNSSGPKNVADTVVEELKNTDINVKFIEYVNLGDRDYKFLAYKIKESKTDFVFAQLLPPYVGELKKQLKESGVNVDYSCILSIDVSTRKEIFEGDWFISDIIFTKDFESEMQNKYGVEVNYGAPNVYDALFLLVDAFENSKDNKVRTIGKYIRNKKVFNGLTGKLKINQQGIMEVRPVVKIIKNGKSIIIEQEVI